KKIDFFLTGADVIFSDGSVMNKIGTHTISIVAQNFKTSHIVLTTTHCYETNDLLNIRGLIEERKDTEIWEKETRPENLLFKNPAFDITPNELIDKFITEVGVFSPESFSIWAQKKRI
ncbi:MAG: ribose 1,5-bisphosphate isomerase, partial [Candidatus ainarchaeum sp.]|nr:ribose 1,5-bisphosphate isomerase [Candidatus ainarchaeum sp.]